MNRCHASVRAALVAVACVTVADSDVDDRDDDCADEWVDDPPPPHPAARHRQADSNRHAEVTGDRRAPEANAHVITSATLALGWPVTDQAASVCAWSSIHASSPAMRRSSSSATRWNAG
jgi:hypothetical protein